jgi:hypothetical protein
VSYNALREVRRARLVVWRLSNIGEYRARRITVVLVSGPSRTPFLFTVERGARFTNRRAEFVARDKQGLIELFCEFFSRVGGNLPRSADIIGDSPLEEIVGKRRYQPSNAAALAAAALARPVTAYDLL